MIFRNLQERIKDFVKSRAENTVDRHQIIVYLLHSTIVIFVISLQLIGLGGSQEAVPKLMGVVHLTACLMALSLYFFRKISIPVAFSLVTLVSQIAVVSRSFYFVQARSENFLQLIFLNQVVSLLAIAFLVMSFVKYTPFLIAIISLVTYGGVAAYLNEPALWNLFSFFFAVEFFFCVLGELLRRNVGHIQMENTDMHHRETAFLHAVKFNEREVEAYLRMINNDQPTPEDTDRLFSMLRPKSQRNLVNAIRQHLKHHLMDNTNLAQMFPTLTKSELDVCNLILQGKKMNEIGQLLDKTEKNVGVVRTHIRKKLNVPTDQDLRKYLMELLVKRRYQGK